MNVSVFLVIITPGLTTITVNWTNATQPNAKVKITLENQLFYRESNCDGYLGSKIIHSLTPAVTYTMTVEEIVFSSEIRSTSILARLDVTLPIIGKVFFLLLQRLKGRKFISKIVSLFSRYIPFHVRNIMQ